MGYVLNEDRYPPDEFPDLQVAYDELFDAITDREGIVIGIFDLDFVERVLKDSGEFEDEEEELPSIISGLIDGDYLLKISSGRRDYLS
jgi:hypothetical protein